MKRKFNRIVYLSENDSPSMQEELDGTAGGAPAPSADIPADPLGEGAESVNWGSFADDDFQSEAPTVEGDVEIAPPKEPTAPIATQPPAETAAPKVVDDVPKPDPTPAVVAPEVVAPTAVEEPAKAEAFDWNAWESNTTDSLAKEYQLTDDEATAMLTEPETILPKLAASVHARVVKNVLMQLPQILPALIQQTMTATERETTQRGQFFNINKDLNDAKYAPAIQSAGQLFRQLNPNASAEAAAIAVGNMVRMSLGLPIPSAEPPAPSVAPKKTQPFIPAQGGSGAGAPAVSTNPFANLAEEFLSDEN